MGRVDETTSVPHLKKKKKKTNKQTNFMIKKNYLKKFLFDFIY